MARARLHYQCRECGTTSPRWAGRCGQCGEWNSIEEAAVPPVRGEHQGPVELAAMPADGSQLLPTGIDELDRVLGGGLVTSSVTLIAGEPGIGKSTLLLQMLAAMARQGRRTLLVSAEESPSQVRMRATRLGIVDNGVWIAGDTDLAAIRSDVAGLRPDVLVVDSVQTISDQESGLTPGAVTTVRACAQALADDAKSGGPAVVLVGHVTKDGSIAGPRVLEHLVDTVLSFEGERHHALRLLRAVKHRFGPVGELGMWEMTATGLQEVADGAAFLLADRRPGMPGSVVFAGMDGRRPILVEIQALVSYAAGGSPRRSASGYDSGRLAQLIAVLDRRAGISLRDHDVYVSVAGGIRLDDPGADLAVAAAVASAVTDRVVPAETVVLGEVGLGGELRQVGYTPRRLAEASRVGFRRAVVARGSAGAADVIELAHPDRPASGLAPAALDRTASRVAPAAPDRNASGLAPAALDRPASATAPTASATAPAAPAARLRVSGATLLTEALDMVLAGRPAGRPKLKVLDGDDLPSALVGPGRSGHPSSP